MSDRPIAETLIQTAHERRRRGPDEGFLLAALHPVDYFALEREIGQAIARGESWALATHRPTMIKALVLPQGLEVRCAPGLHQGVALLEDHRGIESSTMIALASERHTEGES